MAKITKYRIHLIHANKADIVDYKYTSDGVSFEDIFLEALHQMLPGSTLSIYELETEGAKLVSMCTR